MGAIFSEMWYTVRGGWQYAHEMLILPVLEVGLSIILQFMLFPWLSLFIVRNLGNDIDAEGRSYGFR